MRLSTSAVFVLVAAIATSCLVAAGSAAAGRKSGAYAPHIDPANFQTRVENPFFPLEPGTRFTYRETSRGRSSVNEVTVTHDTRVILGVSCVVVHDVVKDGGRIAEETFDWYAQDKQGSVWYFGEASKEIGPRGNVSTEGSWEAGVDGAQPGILMKAEPTVGKPYRQEYYRGHAEDMGQVIAVGDSVTVPYGSFAGCVRTKDWSMLEAGTETKWYAKGVGLVRSQSSSRELSELVSITRP